MFGTITAIIFIIIGSWIANQFINAPIFNEYDEYDESDYL